MGKKDEEVYEVEKILKMRVLKKKREFWVKWKGYTPDHNTWEPEENLAESEFFLNQVTAAATAPERESKRNSEAKKSVERSPSPVIKRSSAVRDSSSPKKKLKYDLEEKDSWEDIVDQVQTVYKSSVQGRFSVEILWKDKTVSTHSNTVVNQKCPQKMISFYEKRLTFEDSD